MNRGFRDHAAHLRPDPFAYLLVLAGAALRFAALGRQSFWHDEIHSVLIARGGDSGTLRETLLNPHGPLYLLLLRGWMHLFGSGEAAVRSLSALLGVAGLALFHRVFARLAGRDAARIALALLVFSPYHLWYSQEGRNYALLFVTGLVAVSAWLDELERPTTGTFLRAVVATAFACLSNLSGFFLPAVEFALALEAARRDGWRMRRFVAHALLLGVVLAPWILAGAGTTGKVSVGTPSAHSDVILAKGESPPGLASIPYTFYDFTLAHGLGPTVDELKQRRAAAIVPHLPLLVPAMALVAVLALAGLAAARGRTRAVLGPWLVVPVLLMAALSFVNLKAANSRYALLAFAPFVGLLAIGIAALRHRLARAGSLVALLALFAWADARIFTDPRVWKPDARAAGGVLAREARASDAVVVYALDFPVRYYTPDSIAFLLPPPAAYASDAAASAWLDSVAAGRSLWLVECQSWWADRDGHLLRAARAQRAGESEWRLEKLPVHRFPPAERR